MSQETKVGGVKAEITADTSGYNQSIEKAKGKTEQFVQSLQHTSGALNQVKEGANDLGEKLRKQANTSENAKAKTKELEHSLQKASQAMAGAKAKAEEFGQSFQKTATSFQVLNGRLADLGMSSVSIDRLHTKLKRIDPQAVEKQLQGVREELKKLGVSSAEIDKLTKKLKRSATMAMHAGAELKQFGFAYAGLSAAIGTAIAKAIKASAGFEQAMAKVKAITGATGEQFAQLEKQSLSLGSTTRYTAIQAAEAQSYLGMAGFKTTQILEAMPSVLALAAAGQMDLARTSDIASNILTGFQLKATEMARVSDVMAKAVTTSNTNVEQLGYAMKYIAPVAASFGISIEETAAAVGKLSDAGIQGEMAGTQLRAMFLRIVRPVKKAKDYMEKLGIQIKETSSLADIIQQFEQAFRRLTQAQQAEVAARVVGIEATSGFLTLIKNGSSTLRGFTEELEHSAGAAQEMANIQFDSLTGAVEEMKSAFVDVGISVGDAFSPALRSIVEWITALFRGFKELDPALQTAIITFAAVTAGVLGLAAAAGVLAIALQGLSIAFPPLLAIAGAIGLVTAGVAALYSSYAEAEERTKKFEQAQQSLNDILEKSPLRRTVEDVKKLQEQEEKLTKLLEERERVEKALSQYGDSFIEQLGYSQEIRDLKDQLRELDKQLEEFKGAEEGKKKLSELRQEMKASVSALMEMQRAEWQDAATKQEMITQMEQLSARYKELAALQTVDQTQKEELRQVTDRLKKEYPELHRVMDEDGRIRVQNIDLIDKQIGAERLYVNELVAGNIKIVAVWETQARAQRASIESQIKNLESLVQVMNAVAGTTTPMGIPLDPAKKESAREQRIGGVVRGDVLHPWINKQLQQSKDELYKYDQTLKDLGKIKNDLKGGDLTAFKPRHSGSGVKLTDEKQKKIKQGAKPSTKQGKSAGETVREQRKKAYDADMATVRFAADYYDWEANKQLAAYEKVRGRHQQHLKATVEDERMMMLQLKRLKEDTVKSRYEVSSEWIRKEERRMQEANQSDVAISQTKLDAWSRLRGRYQKDSEEYKKADEQVYQSRKQLMQAQFDASEEWMEQEARRMEEAKKSEEEITTFKVAAWARLRDRYEKNTVFYKRADEQMYQLRKRLTAKQEEQAEKLVKKQQAGIEEAKKAELQAIEARKKAAVDDYHERVRAIDALIAKEAEFNADADYETKRKEKQARVDILQSAVGPEGIKEREETIKEMGRMELEHKRELRKRDLETQKQSILDEKQTRDEAFDREKADVEAKYTALKDAFEHFSGDVKAIESAIADFRMQTSTDTNAQILSDLDRFVQEYNRTLSQIKSISVRDTELSEYNANKEAWSAAKSRRDRAEMARLHNRNQELRRKYGMGKDGGKLPSFDVGGVVPGPVGHPLFAVVHGGEAVFNPRQLAKLFAMLNAPLTKTTHARPAVMNQSIVNHIDMSVSDVTLEDGADVKTLYGERVKAAYRLQSGGT